MDVDFDWPCKIRMNPGMSESPRAETRFLISFFCGSEKFASTRNIGKNKLIFLHHAKGIIMYCQKCGNEISDNSVFCDSCGEKVTFSPGISAKDKKKEIQQLLCYLSCLLWL